MRLCLSPDHDMGLQSTTKQRIGFISHNDLQLHGCLGLEERFGQLYD